MPRALTIPVAVLLLTSTSFARADDDDAFVFAQSQVREAYKSESVAIRKMVSDFQLYDPTATPERKEFRPQAPHPRLGIVELDDAPYIICVFSTHLADLDDGERFIRQASLLTFQPLAFAGGKMPSSVSLWVMARTLISCSTNMAKIERRTRASSWFTP